MTSSDGSRIRAIVAVVVLLAAAVCAALAVVISALTEQLDKVKAFTVGGVDYLTKPFQMEALGMKIRAMIGPND